MTPAASSGILRRGATLVLKLLLALLFLLAAPNARAVPPSPGFVAIKHGFWDRTLGANAARSLELEGNLAAWTFADALGPGRNVELQVPSLLYWIATTNPTFAVDARVRVALGPLPIDWWPTVLLDVGYVGASEDWVAARAGATHTLVAGGAAVLPLRAIDGVVDLRYADTLVGARLRRFSCGVRWFPFAHVGIAVNGDNWMRDSDDAPTLHAYAWFAGLVLR